MNNTIFNYFFTNNQKQKTNNTNVEVYEGV